MPQQQLVINPLDKLQYGFKISSGQQRDTHSRAEMMAFIQLQMDQLKVDMKDFVKDIDKRWLEIAADKTAMIGETHRFLRKVEK